jgi:hypothetical protein
MIKKWQDRYLGQLPRSIALRAKQKPDIHAKPKEEGNGKIADLGGAQAWPEIIALTPIEKLAGQKSIMIQWRNRCT